MNAGLAAVAIVLAVATGAVAALRLTDVSVRALTRTPALSVDAATQLSMIGL
jgi:hypothetical protein